HSYRNYNPQTDPRRPGRDGDSRGVVETKTAAPRRQLTASSVPKSAKRPCKRQEAGRFPPYYEGVFKGPSPQNNSKQPKMLGYLDSIVEDTEGPEKGGQQSGRGVVSPPPKIGSCLKVIQPLRKSPMARPQGAGTASQERAERAHTPTHTPLSLSLWWITEHLLRCSQAGTNVDVESGVYQNGRRRLVLRSKGAAEQAK
ncbi:hypothetical protein THAOC_21887, partial [Thalassiosira oceanica]